MDALRIQNLSKSFGTTSVIKDMSFTVPEHSIFGFLGANGAGKTTTMKMALGLLKPDAGNIEVFGESVTYGQTATNRMVGYLPDVPAFYGYMTPKEYLELCGNVARMPAAQIRSRTESLLDLVGIDNSKKRIGGFSRGMKQRLGIAQALLSKPKLLICDEPTSALDPVGRKEILDILLRVKEDTTVIFSTHILSDVEKICDHIAILHQGKLALQGNLEEMKAKHAQNQLQITFATENDTSIFLNDLRVQTYLNRSKKTGTTLLFSFDNLEEAEYTMIQVFSDKRIIPLKFEVLEPSLETMFMEVVR